MGRSPNVIFIGIDNLRYDLISSYGDKTPAEDFAAGQPLPETPTLNALAEESFWFKTCVAVAGYTPPSFASAFTGVYPYRHGLVDFRYTELSPNIPTIFELLGRSGYKTVSFARVPVLAQEPLLQSTPGAMRGLDALCRSEQELHHFLDANHSSPIALFAHLMDCHVPFMWTDHDRPGANQDFFAEMQHLFGEDLSQFLPDQRQVCLKAVECTHGSLPSGVDPEEHYAKVVGLYLKGITKFDTYRLAGFVDLLKKVGLWDTSYIVTFSDHGEIRDPARQYVTTHGGYVQESLTRVVCMMRGPGIAAGASDELVGLVDICPTVLELLGPEVVPTDSLSFDGRSLLPLLHGESFGSEQRCYMQEGWMPINERIAPPTRSERGIRTSDGFHYIFRGDVADIGLIEMFNDEEMPHWLADTFCPSRWDVDAERTQITESFKTAGTGADAALSLIFRQERSRPRYTFYDLNTDPLERHPKRISYAPEYWKEYLQKYRWMLAHSAPCQPASAGGSVPSEAEETELAERLRALGYHD